MVIAVFFVVMEQFPVLLHNSMKVVAKKKGQLN
jgi:hypothetical protein